MTSTERKMVEAALALVKDATTDHDGPDVDGEANMKFLRAIAFLEAALLEVRRPKEYR